MRSSPIKPSFIFDCESTEGWGSGVLLTSPNLRDGIPFIGCIVGPLFSFFYSSKGAEATANFSLPNASPSFNPGTTCLVSSTISTSLTSVGFLSGIFKPILPRVANPPPRFSSLPRLGMFGFFIAIIGLFASGELDSVSIDSN